MGSAEDFDKWMEEEDERKKNYKFVEEPIKTRRLPVFRIKEKTKTEPYQLNLFEN